MDKSEKGTTKKWQRGVLKKKHVWGNNDEDNSEKETNRQGTSMKTNPKNTKFEKGYLRSKKMVKGTTET